MEISRIEAVSPRNIDWKNLTARQIIKYDQEGLEVPDIYLQWAKEFVAEINTNDVDTTTYYMANSKEQTDQTPQEEQKITDNEQADTDNSITDATSENKAKQKREELENAGVSILGQAVEFIGDSKIATKTVQESQAQMKAVEEQSANDISSLESHMSELISRAEATQKEIKNEINIANSNPNQTNIGKINELNQKLKQQGIEGQEEISASEGDFNTYEATINDQTNLIINANDFGAETIDIGNEILRPNFMKIAFISIIEVLIGSISIFTGTKAQNEAQKAKEAQNETNSINNKNQETANEMQNRIEASTGVEDTNTNNNNGSNQTETDEAKNNTKQETESEKLASANLDKVLQAKIRRGEE